MQMWSPENIALCAARQAEILRAAARMLAPGGTIVYSTCTFTPEEDEGSVLTFLREHPDFDTVMTDASAILACLADGRLDAGRPDWVPGGTEYAGSLRRAVRLFPHHADGEGHFAVLLRRRADAASGDAVSGGAVSRRAERPGRRDTRRGGVYRFRTRCVCSGILPAACWGISRTASPACSGRRCPFCPPGAT